MRKIIIVLAALLVAAPLGAQVTPGLPEPGRNANGEELVDRVAAVVGDTVLLLSEVHGQIADLVSAGQIPREPDAIDRAFPQVLEMKVNQLILVTAAREAGQTVNEEMINQQVDQRLREIQRQFGSELAFTAALQQQGQTRDQYRQMMAAAMRDEALIADYLRMRMRNRAPPVVDESAIRAFFEEHGQNLGARPASVGFRQVVVSPRPAPEARQAAIARAQEVLDELTTGADFAVLARRFSDDPGSRDHGGDLGWFRQGTGFAPEFERVAFALRPGQTSGIVETEFGFHIIRVERSRGTERQVRHILIQPEITEQDIAAARVRADSVATAIRNGEAIATLAPRYNRGDDPITVRETVDRLPPDYATALAEAQVNDLVGPFQYDHPRGTPRFTVARVTERVEAGEYTLDDVRERIREILQQETMRETILRELRQQIYVNVMV